MPNSGRDNLPRVVTRLSREAVLERLETAAKRGRLPGFARGGSGALFVAAAPSTPFDHELVASASAGGEDTTLEFRLRLAWRAPAITGAALVVSVWPGVHFVDQLLPASWGWVSTHVYWWYLPLSLLSLLWWPAALRRSRSAARASAREVVARIAAMLDARIEADEACGTCTT